MNEQETKGIRLHGADFKYRYFHQCFIWVFLIAVIVIMSFANEILLPRIIS